MKALAMLLLRDEHGISEAAWELLRHELVRNGRLDCIALVQSVEATDGRFYLPEPPECRPENYCHVEIRLNDAKIIVALLHTRCVQGAGSEQFITALKRVVEAFYTAQGNPGRASDGHLVGKGGE